MLYRNQDFSLKFKFINKGKCDVVDYILVLVRGFLPSWKSGYFLLLYLFFIFKPYIFLDLDFSQLEILNGLKLPDSYGSDSDNDLKIIIH